MATSLLNTILSSSIVNQIGCGGCLQGYALSHVKYKTHISNNYI